MSDEGLERDYFDLDYDMSDMDDEPTNATSGVAIDMCNKEYIHPTVVSTFSMETRKLDPSEYSAGSDEDKNFPDYSQLKGIDDYKEDCPICQDYPSEGQEQPVRVSSFDYFYPLFSYEGYSIIPFYKESGMPLTDYVKAQADGDLVRCSSATDVDLGITRQQELGQCCLYGSLDTVFRISAVDAPFILGSQDRLDFYLIPTPKNNERSVTAWRIPTLK